MFSRKYYNRYLDDQFDRQHYGAKLKLKNFDTDEFQSITISNRGNLPRTAVQQEEINVNYCVEVKDVSYHYNVHNPILKKISVNVPIGKIYSLLGASGCGKTTLLRMILGQLKPLTGSIRIFGAQPGTPECNVPGSGVGYMPQDLALFSNFTIEETLHFYGRIYGIPKGTIKKRIKLYVELLGLPEKNRLVSDLSGGQQRRVSLAVTMIHQPPLLILDEPTVGVDSLLRLKIWDYLETLCREQKTTVIITTHYTEEARNSFRVGFIDCGYMLAEDNPQNLLDKYNCDNLEDVFLELCLEKAQPQTSDINNNNEKIMDKNLPLENNNNESIMNNNKEEITKLTKSADNPVELNRKYINSDSNIFYKTFAKDRFINLRRLNALLIKNFILFRRNPNSIILMNIIPVFQIAMFCLSFARNPENIPVAIVNHENRTHSLSNLFLEQMNKKSLKFHYYDNLDDAIESIHKLQTRTVMMFNRNFSRNFRRRFLKPETITDDIIKQSRIGLYTDTTNTVFYLYIYETILNAFEKFITLVGAMMGYNPRFFGSPLDLQKPIYGKFEIQYSEFITPGMVVVLIHGMSLLIGSFSVSAERSGNLERGFVAGIRTSELYLSHVLFFTLPVITQVILCIILTFYIFDIQSQGSLWEVSIMSFLSGMQGLIFGITLSILCPNELASLMVVFSFEMPLIFTSGLLWPIESLPNILYNLALWNPLTRPILATHYIILRGWTLLHYEVILGLISSIGYTSLSLPELIQSRGFLSEEHFVTTEDGYILKLFRIINPYYSSSKNGKRPVILWHGIATSSDCWLFSTDGHIDTNGIYAEQVGNVLTNDCLNNITGSISYTLAACGYDVWLPNSRGTHHSRGHIRYDSSMDTGYWRFSLTELAIYDVPAVISYILRSTNQTSLAYIGHSLGTDQMFALQSLIPESGQLIKPFIALAPVAYLGNIWSSARLGIILEPLLRTFAVPMGLPRAITKFIGIFLCGNALIKDICLDIIYSVQGWDADNFNNTVLSTLISHSFDTTSSWVYAHLSQMVIMNSYQMMDYGVNENLIRYGQLQPPIYPLKDISSENIALFRGLNDALSDTEDVERLVEEINTTLLDNYIVPDRNWNHQDFLNGITQNIFINQRLLNLLERFQNNGKQ